MSPEPRAPSPSVACLLVPALPLQLLLDRHPEWRGRPSGVVERDAPQARLLWVSESAVAHRILPGMHLAQALAIDGDFRAAPVEREEIAAATDGLRRLLARLSPAVEPDPEEPGCFLLSAAGLERLHPDPAAWGERLAEAARGRGFQPVTVTVGWTRFGPWAISHAARGVHTLPSIDAERRAVRRVPLARLPCDPELREGLALLGIETLGELLDLPAAELGERFGAQAFALHRRAAAEGFTPPQGEPLPEPVVSRHRLEAPDEDTSRLVFLLKRMLDPLLSRLAARRRAAAALTLTLRLEDGSRHEESLRPARPTLAGAQLIELLRLRLEGVQLPDRIEEIELELEDHPATAEQLELFRVERRRDPEAAERALARLRAELGAAAVVRVRLVDRWLPSARFLWEPLGALDTPRPRPDAPLQLVRRILARPRRLPPRPRRPRDDGWLIGGLGRGAVIRLLGPHRISGGWWAGGVERDYHFAETRRGDLLWVFFDSEGRDWWLEATVE